MDLRSAYDSLVKSIRAGDKAAAVTALEVLGEAIKAGFVWTSRAQVGLAFGVSETAVQKWVAKGMPGGTGRYVVSEIIQWREAYWRERVELAAADPELVSDSDSPAMERVRIARAKLLELDYEERTDAVLIRDEMVSGMMEVAAHFRSACERLQHEFGPEAYAIMEEAHDAAVRGIKERFGDSSGVEQ